MVGTLNGTRVRATRWLCPPYDLLFVMAGLVPAIHDFAELATLKTWMPGTRPGMTS